MDAEDFLRERQSKDAARTARATELKPRLVVARNVYRLRNERGLTQAELAGEAGLMQPRIAEIENADVTPRLETLWKVARALGVRPSALVTEDGERRLREVHVVMQNVGQIYSARTVQYENTWASRDEARVPAPASAIDQYRRGARLAMRNVS